MFFTSALGEVNFILPIQQIKTKYDDEKNTNTGMADPALFSGYHLIKRLNGYALRQRLIIGAGIKLPVGVFDKQNDDGQKMSLLNQNGTGSIDHFYYINYMMSKKWWGLTTNYMFKINGTNKYNEKYACSYNQTTSFFTKFAIKNVKLFPSAFASYERCKGLLVNGELTNGNNVNALLLGPALDIRYKNFVLNTSFQFNVYERVSSQDLSNAGRFVIGLTYNFTQEKYLIKNKN
ncbi:MAG: hypothetical protein H0U95_09155 [Bacteroidetes bacterium]|nr:hypothetical protein [Bacteroidota bacterium]